MIEQIGAEHVDLKDLIPDNDSCRERGCRLTYMERFEGEEMWRVYHSGRDRYAMTRVSHAMTQAPEWPEYLDHILAITHDAMDHLGERKPA